MLIAMTVSTASDGRLMTPSVAAAKVIECARGEGCDRPNKAARCLSSRGVGEDQEHQAEYKEEVVDAEGDMLDPEQGISAKGVPVTWPEDKRRVVGSDPS